MAYDDDMFVPPWREWSNDFINAEKWDQFRGKRVFVHPGGHERLPKEIAGKVKEWKRPDKIFGIDELVVQPTDDKNDILNVLAVNEPLMNVKVYRWILYHVVLYSTRFQNEWPQPWHPSSLIFSRCGVEVSQNKQSKPEYNSFGKYWLKLYFMGKFRMVCVSDHLPVSDDNRVLLPLCENHKVLWLPLLVKGLLRINATIGESPDQFNTITCLTGWSCIRQNCHHISKEDLWSSILCHSSNPVVDNEHSEYKIKKPKPSKNNTMECFPISTSEGTQCYRERIISNSEDNPSNSIEIAITLSSTACKNKQNDSLSRYAQPIFLNHVKITKNESLETWKKYRWAQWAVENKIIKKHEINDFTKLVNIHAPCAVSLKQSCPLMKVLSEYQTVGDEMQYELDFLYLEPFAKYIEFYVKSSQAFPFVKPVLFKNEKNNEGDSNASGDSTPTEHALHNCCVYLHFESPYCESMLFTLSVCEDYIIRNGNVTVLDMPSYHNIDMFVSVEKFHWYEAKLPTPLSSIYIRTKGVSNVLVKFEPGVNVLRVWGVLPTNYSLTIESTVDFSIHQTAQTIYSKLTEQPKSLTRMLAPIKQSFLQLCAAEPNTGDHGQKLLKFYSSFMPRCAEQENELKKIERFSIISKHVHVAVLKCIEHNFSNDLNAMNDLNSMIEVYKELQEVFQSRSLGQKQLSDLSEQIKLLQQKEHNIKSVASSRKKSNIKSKSTNNKRPFELTTNKASKPMVSKCIIDFMFEILCDVLNSENINMDEYYLKNDLLNYVNGIIYDETSTKRIDRLLLFRLDLNSHSITELAPTVIQLSVKTCNNSTINLTLIDNDSQTEVKPINIDMTLFMVNRTTRGYTLLGWFSEKLPDEERCSYKLSFYGRPCQMLHPCGTQKDNYFYKYGTSVCDSMSTPDIVTKRVNTRLCKPNAANLLTRVFLKIENAAQFTIYFQTEYLIDRTMELRVTDKDNSSTVFASTYAKGKTAMIPSVFLDPNYNNTQQKANDKTENTTNSILFAIEVIQIKNIEIDYTNVRDESNNYDWTISCAYDQKLTDITLETDTSSNYFQFNTSIPHQINTQNPISSANAQVSNIITPTTNPSLNTTANTDDKTHNLQPNYNFRQMVESMTITDDMLEKITMDDSTKSSTSLFKEDNTMNEIFERQNSIANAIKKFDDTKTEHRQNFVDEPLNNVLNFLHIQQKSNINVRQSRVMKNKISSIA